MTTQHSSIADLEMAVEGIREDLRTHVEALEGWYELRVERPESDGTREPESTDTALRSLWYDTMSHLESLVDKLTALVGDGEAHGWLQGKQPMLALLSPEVRKMVS